MRHLVERLGEGEGGWGEWISIIRHKDVMLVIVDLNHRLSVNK